MTQTDEISPNGQQQQDVKEDRPCVYTMSGVLHFLQHEWSKHEIDKCRWDMERAELQARISFLQGERRGQENLKADLLRRIKMLEYCLKQERAKNYRLTHNGEDPPVYEEEATIPDILNQEALHTLSKSEPKEVCGEYVMGRALLKQFLNEVGYSEKMLDVRNFRGTRENGPSGNRLPTPPDLIKRDDDSDSEDVNGSKFDDDANFVDSSFDFLKKEKTDMGSKGSSYAQRDTWSNTPSDIMDRLKDRYLSDQHRRLHPEEEYDDKNASKGRPQQASNMPNPFPELDIADIGLGDDPRDMDIKTNYDEEGDDPGLHQMKWSTKTTLRSHMDSVRAMQFHPVEPVLFTASDDGTIKMWNLDTGKTDKPNAAEGIEPVYTFRGHLGPVVCIDLSLSGDTLYSGGHDGALCCWNVPSSTIDQHAAYDPKVLYERIKAHQDVIWSVVYHSSANRLVSAGADNTVKLWEPGNYQEPLVKTIESPEGVGCPVSVDFVSTEPTQLLIAYQKFQASLVNIETGEVVRNFDFGQEESCHLTRIISHPTMQITVVASDDRKIRYFDNITGQLMHSAVAHTDSVSSLSVDSNGLYLLSGSHDGSLRLWHMEKRVCLQEISAHRKKFDAAVMSVAFHPSRMIIGSTGADGLVKVFTTSSE